MDNYKYTITNKLLSNIKRINSLIVELNSKKLSRPVLMKMRQSAREISSFSSTSIEGNPLPLTEVKKILKNTPQNIRDSEREVINYNKSLKILEKLTKKKKIKLNLQLILDAQKQVTDKLLPTFQSGKLRGVPVVINNPKERKIIYLPPDAKDCKNLIEKLVDFINKNQGLVDPLILAGIFHKQFVIIHPFADGNGRTTRLITTFLLAKMGLNTFNIFSFENFYNQNVTKYFQNVGVFGNFYEIKNTIDFTKWLEYFTDGIIDELLQVEKSITKNKLQPNPNTQLQSHLKEVVKHIEEHGFIKDSDYKKLTTRAKATRVLDFSKLIKLGLIKRHSKGKNTYYKLATKSSGVETEFTP